MGSRTVCLVKVSANPINVNEEGSLPKWAIKRFDGLSIKILDCLLVAPADAIIRTRIAIKGVNRLGNTHLRGGHRW